MIPHLNRRAMDDYRLVQQAVEGSQPAFEMLYERHNVSLFNFIHQRTRNLEEARDLTLEAFGKAFTRLHSYVPNYAFSTWLFRIAHNHYIDFVRRNKVAKVYETPVDVAALLHVKETQNNPEEIMVRQDRIVMVLTLLQLVNPRYRRILELRYFEELSYEEMAIRLGLPVGTVKTQLFRAKEMMRELLNSPAAMA